jgi:hypothetical protein
MYSEEKVCSGRKFDEPTNGFRKITLHDQLSVHYRVTYAPPPVTPSSRTAHLIRESRMRRVERDPAATSSTPVPFPRRLEDNFTCPSYGVLAQEHGKVVHGEGIFVGCRDRWYHASRLDMVSRTCSSITPISLVNHLYHGRVYGRCCCRQRGLATRARSGAGLFVSDTVSSSPRPARELKGFKQTRKLGLGE